MILLFLFYSKLILFVSWQDYASTKVAEISVKQAETLWIYGDSVAQNFLKSLVKRGICKRYFKKCKNSHMWIYEVWNLLQGLFVVADPINLVCK